METEVMVRALIAIGLSGILGWERESAGKSAGVRTHMLVGLGAALFVISDATLALNRFRRPFRAAQAIVMSTYVVGQALIALSI